MRIRIGTRGSALALWQARTVARLINETGGPECEIVIIRTSGDEPQKSQHPQATQTRDPQHTPNPTDAEGPPNIKAQFVKEIEDALLERRIDVAVHSAKDLPAVLPDGLTLAAALEREDPRDALLMPAMSNARGLTEITRALGRAPRVGTSSVRREAQLRRAFPNATFVAIRGNVDTRLRKLDAGECDVLVLAAAGVKRLGLEGRISARLPVDVCVPAPGQGIVSVEIRADADTAVRDAVKRISDADSEASLLAERAVVLTLGGGCQMPLGVVATLDGMHVDLQGVVMSRDGRTVIKAAVRGNRGAAAATGEKLASQLLAKGAGDVLK